MPSNVGRFEQLMYLTVGIGLIGSVLSWNRSVARASALGGATLVLFVQLSVLALMVLFIWLAARRHKNWARWLLLIVGIMGLPSYVGILGHYLEPLAGVLILAQLLFQVIAFVLIFTGNARDWFKPCPPQSI